MVQSGKEWKGAPPDAPSVRTVKGREEDDLLADIERLKQEENQRKQAEYNKLKLEFSEKVESQWTRYNNKIIQAKFLKLMRNSKVKTLKKDIEAMQAIHNTNCNRLDAIIHMYMKDVFEAEEQYQMALHSHQQGVDQLIEIFMKRVESIEQQFRQNLTRSKQDHDKDMNQLKNLYGEQKTEIRQIIDEMKKRNEKENEELYRNFAIAKKMIVNTYSNAFQVMKIQMGKEIKQKQQQYKEENENQGKPIAEFYNDYEVLRSTNDDLAEKIDAQNQQIRKNERSLALWKAKWLNNLRESQRRNSDLKMEISALKGYFHEVKKKMKTFREGESRRLTALVTNSRNTSKVMDEQICLSERILQQSILNQKHETEMERIPMDLDLDQNRIIQGDSYEREVETLSKFYNKYNKVLLDKTALEEEKARLMERNTQLRAYLKDYLDSISVNPEILERPNPLLIVEQLNSQSPSRPVQT